MDPTISPSMFRRSRVAWRGGVNTVKAGLAAALLWAGIGLGANGAAEESVPAFSLRDRASGNRVTREDFAGQIVVVDFFAYWCAPCLPASRALEQGVRRHYAPTGNARGVPVRVLSVNIEPAEPARTDAFVQQVGAHWVVEDPHGAWLERLGGTALPYLVIVDGSSVTNGSGSIRVVHRQTGFQGVESLRRVIDGLGPATAPTAAGPAPRPVRHDPGGTDWPSVETEFEALWADDLLLTETKGGLRQDRGRFEWSLSYAYASYAERYRPFRALDFFGFAEDLSADRQTVQGEWRQKAGDRLSLLFSASGYTGYPNFRRVWIANRYRQKYDHPQFTRVPGYEEPDPQGARAALGARWEYWPGQGFGEVRAAYGRDQVAPGYEDSTNALGNFRLAQGRERLDTVRLNVSSENVWTTRLRTLQEFGFAWVTDRDLRLTYKGSANLALADRWSLRTEGGVTTEPPSFDAWFVGAAVIWEPAGGWSLGVSARSYRDTGEIEDALLVTSAAPAVRVWQAALELRWAGPRAAFKIAAGPIVSDYDRRPGVGEEFVYLFSDRHWGLAQAAASLSF